MDRHEDRSDASYQNHIDPIRLKNEEWRGFSMAQRTKERGDCVDIFKDPDYIVVATTGIHLDIFSLESTLLLLVHLFTGAVDGEGILSGRKLLGTFCMTLHMV